MLSLIVKTQEMSLNRLLGDVFSRLPVSGSRPTLHNVAIVGVASGVVLLGYVLWIVIYRLYFHPLAKYPGPFWARITNLYDFYIAYGERRAQHFGYLHEKYGLPMPYPNKRARG